MAAGDPILSNKGDERVKIPIDFNFQENELDRYGNYTVNFKLFMLNERNLNDKINETKSSDNTNDFLDIIGSIPKITLAQSGRTSLYIEDVRIRNVVSHKPNRPAGVAQNIEFKVIEPFGTKFMDLIRTSADKLGIESYSKIPWYLELSFVGYKDGEFLTSNISTSLKKLYRISIIKIGMKVETQGTTYSLEAVEAGHRFLEDISGRTEEVMNLSIRSSKTGEFTSLMKKFQDEAQRIALRLAVIDSVPLELPYFVFHEIEGAYSPDVAIKWESLRLTSNPNFDNKAGDYSSKLDTIGDGSSGELKKFSVPNRYRYPAIIQAMLAATDWGKIHILDKIFPKLDELQNAQDKNKSRNERKHTLPPFLKFIKIVPEVIYLDYNLKVKDYNKIVIYNIYPYDGVNTWIKTMDDRIASMKDPKGTQRDLIRNKLQNTARRGVQKKYTYTFGRDNTHVEQMNLEYNTLFYSFIAPGNNFRSATYLGSASPLIESEDGRFHINNLTSRIDTVSAKNMEEALARLQTKLNELDNFVGTFGDDGTEITGAAARELEQAQRERTEVQRQRASLVFSLNPSILAERARKQSLIDHKKNPELFAEDIENPAKLGLNAVISTPLRAAGHLADSDLYTGTSLANPESTSVFNALANNIVQSGDMLQMELTIRGDPWWLGTSPAETFIIKGRTLLNSGIIDIEKIQSIQQKLQALIFQGSLLNDNSDVSSQINIEINEIFNTLVAIPTASTSTSDTEIGSKNTNNIIRSSATANADLNSGIERNKRELIALYGQPTMLFQMFSPDVLATTEDTGIASLTENAMISGLWIVNEVETVFGTDGKFMQTLISVRDTATSSVQIIETLKQNKPIDNVGDPSNTNERVKTDKDTVSVAAKNARVAPSRDTLLARAAITNPTPAETARRRELAALIPKAPGERTSDDARKLEELSKLSLAEIRKLAQLRTLPRPPAQLPEE